MQLPTWQKIRAFFDLEEAEWIEIAIAVGASILMAYLGPFGTRGDLPPLPRSIYWALAIGAGFLGGNFYDAIVRPRIAAKAPRALSHLFSLSFIIVFALTGVLILETIFRETPPLSAWGNMLISVAVVSAAIFGVMLLNMRAFHNPVQTIDPALTAFRARLPVEMQTADILVLSAEDHYVRVVTPAGEALLAGKFSDALLAVTSLDGIRTHRSWWVATQAVTSLDRTGGKWQLIVTHGGPAPVSRHYRPDVRLKGWDKLNTTRPTQPQPVS